MINSKVDQLKKEITELNEKIDILITEEQPPWHVRVGIEWHTRTYT
jgi:hypothetical protein